MPFAARTRTMQLANGAGAAWARPMFGLIVPTHKTP
jgi:hypothetical protein